jgi:hypothetical protein
MVVNVLANVLFAADQRLDTLTLNGNARVTLATGNKGIFANGLTIGPAATLDLSDGTLAVQPGATTAETLRPALRSAYNTGRWDGPGITSSFAQLSHAQGQALLGIALLPNDNGAGQPRIPMLAGQALDASTLILRAALYGDFNADRKVNIADFFTLDSARALRNTGYASGDLNHSGGPADAEDYMLIDRAFLRQSQLPAGGPASAAPPASLPSSPDLWPSDDEDEPLSAVLL